MITIDTISQLKNLMGRYYSNLEVQIISNEQQLEVNKQLRETFNQITTIYNRIIIEPLSLRVFLSSTFIDLIEYRKKVIDGIRELNFEYIGMEDFPPDTNSAKKRIEKYIAGSDIYLGLIGAKYGSIEIESGISYTQLEYQIATNKNSPTIEILIFYLGDEALVKMRDIENKPDCLQKLNDFKSYLISKHLCKWVNNEIDLKEKVKDALSKKEKEIKGRIIQDLGQKFNITFV